MASVSPTVSLLDEISDFLASAPTVEQIIDFRPSEQTNQRLHDLLDKNSESTLNAEEKAELEDILTLGHLLNMTVLKARLRLASK